MTYRVLGVYCGLSDYGFDISFTRFQESGGNWSFEIVHAQHYTYPDDWKTTLAAIATSTAQHYLKTDKALGSLLGQYIHQFIEQYTLHFKVQLVAFKGYPAFTIRQNQVSSSLGSGAAVAALAGIPVVSNFEDMDTALGGDGTPVGVAHQLLFPQFHFHLNLSGTPVLSVKNRGDFSGSEIESSSVEPLEPDINAARVEQIKNLVDEALQTFLSDSTHTKRLLLTGHKGWHDDKLEEILRHLSAAHIAPEPAQNPVMDFIQPLTWSLCAVLRWRDEYNFKAAVTGAVRNSIGGALWMGAEA